MKFTATTRREKIICIGDLLVDVWWRAGMAKRNIENAAVAITSGPGDCRVRPGGAGLFAHTAALAGFDVELFSVADDAVLTERVLKKLRRKMNIDGVAIISEFKTPVKTRYVNGNGHIIVRHDDESNSQPEHAACEPQSFAASLQNAACVVVSDYSKQCIDANLSGRHVRAKIVAAARHAAVPVFVDAKPRHLREYAGAALFKLNRAELEGLLGNEPDRGDFESAIRAAALILATPLLIVTDGSRGVGWCLRGQTGFMATPKKYSSGNCVGAGDTFFVGLLLGLSELGIFDTSALTVEHVPRIVKIAMIAAGQRVRANGDKPFNAKKILQEARGAQTFGCPAHADKIVSPAELGVFSKLYRTLGRQIVFTNGCFDLLHDGHLQLLEFAKQQGDILVVAVDSDDNVRAAKGAGRPIQNQNTRAANLAALEGIDAVCIFGDTVPDGTLPAIVSIVDPDVLVKGADYEDTQIIGADIVERRGGRVALCPLLPNVSTTALVNKSRMRI